MKILYSIVLFAFISIGIFGFSGFTTDHHSAFMSCLKSVTGSECVQLGLPMAVAHANSYLNFTTAILTVFALIFIVYISTSDLIAAISLFRQMAYRSYAQDLVRGFQIKHSFLYWLGLFEKKSSTLSA